MKSDGTLKTSHRERVKRTHSPKEQNEKVTKEMEKKKLRRHRTETKGLIRATYTPKEVEDKAAQTKQEVSGNSSTTKKTTRRTSTAASGEERRKLADLKGKNF